MTEPSASLLHRLLFFFFALFVFGSTFSIAVAQTALMVATLLFIIVAVREKHNPIAGGLRIIYLLIGLYIVWLAVSSLMGATPLKSLLSIREEWLFIAMLIAVYMGQRAVWRDRLVTYLAAGVGIFSLYAVVQFFTGTHWIHFIDGKFEPTPIVRASGNFTHYLTFANYYATAGLFLFMYALMPSEMSRRRQVFILATSIVAMVAVFLTGSRTPIVAVVIALAVCAVTRAGIYRKLVFGVVIILAVVAVLLPSTKEKFVDNLGRDVGTAYEGSRTFIWQRSLDIVAHHPVFGVGQGNFKEEYVSRLRPDIPEERRHSHAHNDFINIAATAGIPAALLFLGIWAVALRRLSKASGSVGIEYGCRRLAWASLVGATVFLMTSLTEATFADEEVRQLLMFIWGLGLAVWYKGWIPAGAKSLDR